MKLPIAVTNLIEAFQRLPGIGPKSAARLAYYLLSCPQSEIDRLAEAAQKLKTETVICSRCFTVAESDPCEICADEQRNQQMICVVETPLNVLALEKTGQYHGVYHVLGGVLNPLANIGPEEIRVKELLERVKKLTIDNFPVEVILALNPTMEGEATSMYISKNLKSLIANIENLKITQLAMGLPSGGDLEYADDLTLSQALSGRREFTF